MGTHKVKIHLSDEQYELYCKVRKEYIELLDGMTEEERKRWFTKLLFRKAINFEKEIDGTIYCVTTHFNSQAKTSVFDRIERLIEQTEK